MQNSLRLFATSLLAIVIFSIPLTLPAHATSWVGNDDGEFDVTGTPWYVGLQESFSTLMAWSSSPPSNQISMQYNPDRDTSYLSQYQGHWFQAGIVSDAAGCGYFTIQIYQLRSFTIQPPVFTAFQDFPPGKCSFGYLDNGANWVIREDMVSPTDQHIADVYFSIVTSSGSTSYASYSYLLYAPNNNYWWLRSNLCWCGTAGGSTSFTRAYGTSTVYTLWANLNAIDPPFDISTAENSNMPYTLFNNVGTQSMWQHFGWSVQTGGPCHPNNCPNSPAR